MNNFDVNKIRADFPILSREIHNRPFIYFDNAATTQKPQAVIDRVSRYYELENANIHRGAHFLANEATGYYEAARQRIADFINAKYSHEVIFTKGTTESINLVAFSFCERFLNEGDEIIISSMEHHANIVPWQMACERKKAHLKVLPMGEDGVLLIDRLQGLLTERTRIIALSHISNVLGTINPIKRIIDIAHRENIPVLVDAAQSVPHQKIDVQELGCDFLCFSGHKMYAPMGIGVLYAKEHFLNEMPPYQGGGEMISKVTFSKTTYNDLPFKFEAGTPDVGGALGLHAAIDYLEKVGFDKIQTQETLLLNYATQKLQDFGDVRIIGTAKDKSGLISFLLRDIHPYDAGTLLDQLGIAIRTGHHCADPIMDFFDVTGTMRISFSFYNTMEEIDSFINALGKVREILT